MAPSATSTELPPTSSFEELLIATRTTTTDEAHPKYLHTLASNVLFNLQHQHDWSSLATHTHSSPSHTLLPRPIVSGLPPKRAYIHPDEQIEILKAEHDTGERIPQSPEQEWVLPTHWEEKWTLAKFAAVFDALDTVPPSLEGDANEQDSDAVGAKWQGKNRQKRLLLATVHDDSTVIYYIIHDGLVKPRQN